MHHDIDTQVKNFADRLCNQHVTTVPSDAWFKLWKAIPTKQNFFQ